ncbi:putative fascin, glycoside hydrolase superfamily [Rosa chinensis]|uniref:Putative fascin, glycoside hydrolase superfamily n=1 Tax=Rosa chinensis TaxID=74649 RepID=A0A2P6QCF9_ROSCH|nr:putative fascin, glycoside hydrolase superfamily [Rosa chinensis]
MELVLSKWVCTFLLCSWLIFSPVYSVVGLHGDSKVRAEYLGGWLVVEGWIKPSLFDGIPNGDMLDGTVVQLKSVTLDKYVFAENGGGANVSVSRDVASSWETLRVRCSIINGSNFVLVVSRLFEIEGSANSKVVIFFFINSPFQKYEQIFR